MALVVERAGSFEGLEKPWADLWHRSAAGQLFVSYDWCRTWWNHFGAGHDLWLLLVRDGDDLAAIAPMMLRRVRYNGLPTRMLGLFANKHVSRATILGGEDREDVLHALVAYCKHHTAEWDVLKLERIPTTLEATRAFSMAMADCLRPFPFETTNLLYYLKAEQSWDVYYQARPQSFKKSFRLGRNRLQKSGPIQFRTYNTDRDLEEAFQALWDVESRSWKRHDPIGANTAIDRSFYADLARAALRAEPGGYEIHLLQLGHQNIAALSTIRCDGVIYFLLMCYDEQHEALFPGRMLFAQIIQDVLTRSIAREIDFNGDSEFIRFWTDTARSFGAMSVCHTGAYSKVLTVLKRMKRTWSEGLSFRQRRPRPGDNKCASGPMLSNGAQS